MVEPIHLNDPLASAGFNIFEASIEPPDVAPAPITVCISSINNMLLVSEVTILSIPFSLSSKSPLYLVPANNVAISKE